MKKIKKVLNNIEKMFSKIRKYYWRGMWPTESENVDLEKISNSDLAKMQKKEDETKINVYTFVFFICITCFLLSLYFLVCSLGSNMFSWKIFSMLFFSTFLFAHWAHHFYGIMRFWIVTKSGWDDFYDEMIED